MKKAKNKTNLFAVYFAGSVICLLIILIIGIIAAKPVESDKGDDTSEASSLPTTSNASSKPESVEETPTAVTGISFDKTEISMYVGYYLKINAKVLPKDAPNQKVIWSSSDNAVATVTNGTIAALSEGSCIIKATSDENGKIFAEARLTVTNEIVENATYIEGVLIVNKTYSLPEGYNPGTNAVAKNALDEMFAAAKKDGITLKVVSGFRSYETQKTLYGNYVKRDGQEAADRYSARAGHSEHQSGLSFDLNSTNTSFADTKEGKWIAANAHKYGFIVRYPEDKEEITGYMYEPWHVRYLGKDMAQRIYDSELCLEEYFNITSVYAE